MKGKRLFSILLVFCLIITSLISTGSTSAAVSLEGDGSEKSPYLIRTVEDFNRMDGYTDNYFKLMNDLDFQNINREPISFNGNKLDGDTHVLKNVKMYGEKDMALFSSIDKALIKNLGIDGARITSAEGDRAGVLFVTGGAGGGTITIKDCYIKNAVVYGKSKVGVFGAELYNGNFENCYVSGSKVYASENQAGGLIGSARWVKLLYCHSNADVDGARFVGGLVGSASEGTSTLTMEQCSSTGNITGNDQVGGLAGAGEKGRGNIYIYDSYFAGSVLSMGYGSGIVSSDNFLNNGPLVPSAYIVRSYATGNVQAEIPDGLGHRRFETAWLYVTDGYFDYSNITAPDTQVRKTSEMYKKANYKNWDFKSVWSINEGKDYPKLINTPEVTPDKKKELKLILVPSEQQQLSVENELIDNKQMIFTSSVPSVAAIDQDGIVTGIKKGSTVITVQNADGDFLEELIVLVTE